MEYFQNESELVYVSVKRPNAFLEDLIGIIQKWYDSKQGDTSSNAIKMHIFVT